MGLRCDFTFNPKFGFPVWVGRMFDRASYAPRAFCGMDLGLTVGRLPESGATTVYHPFARSVLSTNADVLVSCGDVTTH